MAEQQSIYAAGLFFNRVKPETPDSVKAWKKGSISIDVAKFSAQLAELKGKANEKGYIYFDLTENEKDGQKFLSFRLNDWRPEAPVSRDNAVPPLDDSSIPF